MNREQLNQLWVMNLRAGVHTMEDHTYHISLTESEIEELRAEELKLDCWVDTSKYTLPPFPTGAVGMINGFTIFLRGQK